MELKRTVLQKSAIPLYVAALVWLVLSFLLPTYRWYAYPILILCSVLAYLAAKRFCPDRQVEADVEFSDIDTGNADVDRAIEEGKELLMEIARTNTLISDSRVTEHLSRIELACYRIFEYVAAHPDSAKQLRRMLNYYLPTTLKLVKSYHEVDSQNLTGKNASDIVNGIENAVVGIADAFEKQLDNLYEDRAMDISTEISVLEGILKSEGLLDQSVSLEDDNDDDNKEIEL